MYLQLELMDADRGKQQKYVKQERIPRDYHTVETLHNSFIHSFIHSFIQV
jgi:hypothetical protein